MNREKLYFLLREVGCDIPIYIENVLNDSKEDPHYSAVHASNLIKCYVELMLELGENIPFHDVKSCILFEGFNKKEYEAFEKSRKEEAEYYRGKQF